MESLSPRCHGDRGSGGAKSGSRAAASPAAAHPAVQIPFVSLAPRILLPPVSPLPFFICLCPPPFLSCLPSPSSSSCVAPPPRSPPQLSRSSHRLGTPGLSAPRRCRIKPAAPLTRRHRQARNRLLFPGTLMSHLKPACSKEDEENRTVVFPAPGWMPFSSWSLQPVARCGHPGTRRSPEGLKLTVMETHLPHPVRPQITQQLQEVLSRWGFCSPEQNYQGFQKMNS